MEENNTLIEGIVNEPLNNTQETTLDDESPITSPRANNNNNNNNNNHEKDPSNNRLNITDDLNNSTFVNNLLTSLKTRSQSDPKQLQRQNSINNNNNNNSNSQNSNNNNGNSSNHNSNNRNMQQDSNDIHPEYFYSQLNSITEPELSQGNYMAQPSLPPVTSVNNNNNTTTTTTTTPQLTAAATSAAAKRKAAEDAKDEKSKGLRYLSYKVCQKVQSKKTTSYVEVSNELLNEYIEDNRRKAGNQNATFKTNTVKRRIYDVLNVFQAMNIITKDKQKISWVGLPTGLPSEIVKTLGINNNNNNESDESSPPSQNENQSGSSQQTTPPTPTITTTTTTTTNTATPNTTLSIAKQLEETKARVQAKKRHLKELNAQESNHQILHNRNLQMEHKKDLALKNRIFLPFMVLSTQNSTVIDCEVENERSKYFFNFSQSFNIIDDNSLIKDLLGIPPSPPTPTTNRSQSMPAVLPSQQATTTTTTTTSTNNNSRKKRKKDE